MTGKTDIAPVSAVVAIQLILKATQDSDLPSIKEYFDRIDGKVVEVVKHMEADKVLMAEEIELIPSNGNGKQNRVKKFINN